VSVRSDEIHLSVVFQEDVPEPALNRYRALLTAGEIARAERFVFEKHRSQQIITRALLRTVLSGYAGIDPGAWCFTTNPYGRPQIAAPNALPEISFNLAHTDGLVVCGCTRSARLGVDAEHMHDRDVSLDLAARYFSAEERAQLQQAPAAERRERFLQYWTLKESYIKAIGRGLSTPLDQFSFSISPSRHIGLSFQRSLHDSGENWRCWLLRLPHRYVLALCAERKGASPPRIVAHRVIPLARTEPLKFEIIAQSH